MNTDSYFAQGAGHTICQDYATTRENERFVFAVVSDGCSSSPKSEIGASVLSQTFIQSYIESWQWADNEVGGQHVVDTFLKAGLRNKLKEIARHTGLPNEAFDATLVAAVADKESGIVSIFIWGDGHVVLQLRDGTESILSAKYPTNAPYYFSYELGNDQSRQKQYLKLFGDNRAQLSRNNEESVLIAPFSKEMWDVGLLSGVSVYSDGIETFSRVENEVSQPVPLSEILTSLKYKSTVGEFVKRRFTRFLKECRDKEVSHYDDVSCASINFV